MVLPFLVIHFEKTSFIELPHFGHDFETTIVLRLEGE